LHGSTPEETNSISDPEHLVPVSSTLHNLSASFDHTIPPYSIQVLDLEAH
jgi:alpha-N-arabinofuranosidase